MNKYVITYNNAQNLFDEYEVIEGKNPKDALKNAYGKDFERLTGDRGRYADIILVKGDFKNNTIYYEGKCQRLCYGVTR